MEPSLIRLEVGFEMDGSSVSYKYFHKFSHHFLVVAAQQFSGYSKILSGKVLQYLLDGNCVKLPKTNTVSIIYTEPYNRILKGQSKPS